jgi:deazaflavin-dependent oxidoreductase (nitroreductase family)
VVIASQGGMPTHPNWYHNLSADPAVEVQVGADRFAARARTAEGDERERLWGLMTGIWPNFNVYQTRTERRIPVVVLERSGDVTA